MKLKNLKGKEAEKQNTYSYFFNNIVQSWILDCYCGTRQQETLLKCKDRLQRLAGEPKCCNVKVKGQNGPDGLLIATSVRIDSHILCEQRETCF